MKRGLIFSVLVVAGAIPISIFTTWARQSLGLPQAAGTLVSVFFGFAWGTFLITRLDLWERSQ